jgi:hypothetical protein
VSLVAVTLAMGALLTLIIILFNTFGKQFLQKVRGGKAGRKEGRKGGREGVKGRETERERDRARQRERERQRETERERERARHTLRARETDRHSKKRLFSQRKKLRSSLTPTVPTVTSSAATRLKSRQPKTRRT